MESGQEGKDFFQPFFLDPPDPEQVPGAPEPPDPGSFHNQRCRSRVGDPGETGQFPHSRTVDVDPVSQEIFLSDPERGISRGVDRRGPARPGVGTGREKYRFPLPGYRQVGIDRTKPRGGDIPDQNDQGYKKATPVSFPPGRKRRGADPFMAPPP